MHYIAYGSNMNLEQMAHRCPGSRVVGRGELRGWKLAFNVHADIVPGGGEDVTPVVVWEIAPEDWARLDRYEGYPRYYVKEEIETHLDGGELETCVAYVMAPGRKGSAPPDARYFDIIEEGYRENGIDARPLYDALAESQGEEFIWRICGEFREGQSYADYREDIRRYLMLCGWHYSREDALRTIEADEVLVREAYEAQEPVASIAVGIGYCCG